MVAQSDTDTCGSAFVMPSDIIHTENALKICMGDKCLRVNVAVIMLVSASRPKQKEDPHSLRSSESSSRFSKVVVGITEIILSAERPRWDSRARGSGDDNKAERVGEAESKWATKQIPKKASV